jgi:hypothetical protein
MNKRAIIVSMIMAVAGYAEPSKARGPASANTSYEKHTTIDFEARSVDGQFMSPGSAAVKGDQNLDFDSLLDPKKSFTKELKRDAGAVR